MRDERIIFTPEYTIHYGHGRLADIYIGNKPIETVQVRDYNFETGEFGQEPDDESVKRHVADFLNESGGIELYRENLGI